MRCGFLFAVSAAQTAGIGVGILTAVLFAWSVHSRICGKPGAADIRGRRLGWMALFCGPVLALLIACLCYTHLAPNFAELAVGFAVLGGCLGLFAGAIFWATTLLSSWVIPHKPNPPGKKPGEVWDHEMDGGT